MTNEIQEWWPSFLLECRQRTDAFNQKPVDPIFKYFIKTELQDAEAEQDDD
jgi:hypothetical protein